MDAVEIAPVKQMPSSSSAGDAQQVTLLNRLERAITHIQDHTQYFREGSSGRSMDEISARVLLEILHEQVASREQGKV